MALKITLKPHERLIIGGAVVTNGSAKSDFIIENNVPVLREKDVLTTESANTPCKRIYLVVQLMYVDEKNLVEHHNTYWKLIRDVVNAAPSALGLIEQLSEQVLYARYYQALKLARQLIEYEQEVIHNVREPVGNV